MVESESTSDNWKTLKTSSNHLNKEICKDAVKKLLFVIMYFSDQY